MHDAFGVVVYSSSAARRVTASAIVWVMDGAMIDKTKHDDLGDCGLAGKRKEVRIGNVN